MSVRPDSRVRGLRLKTLVRHSTCKTTLITVLTEHEGPTFDGWQLLHDVIISWFPFFFLCSFSSPSSSLPLPLYPLSASAQSPLAITERQVTTQTPESGQPEVTLSSCTASWLRELKQIWPLVSSSVKWGWYPLYSNVGIKQSCHSLSVKKHLIPGRHDHQFKSQWVEHPLSVDITLGAGEAT